jgi:Uma2 family endonuclease
MAMLSQLDRFYTREEVLAFPDDGMRYELVHGELLVSPSPRTPHQVVVGRLYAWLFTYCARVPVGRAMLSPADLSWGKDDILVQPDVFVMGLQYSMESTWEEMFEFPLFIEVLSPSTARYDRFTKRRLYQEMGVPMYWMVDIPERRVEVWTPGATFPQYLSEQVTWQPAGAKEPFVVDLRELFAP